MEGRDATVTARHRFTERFIDTVWTIQRHADVIVEAQFPSYGRGTVIEAIHRDGTATRLGASWVALDDVERFELGGYAVIVDGARARALRVAPQSTAPQPGPTLVVRVGDARVVRARMALTSTSAR
jgi:hypothetical protein